METDTSTSSPPTSSGPPSPSSSPSGAGCWAAHISGLLAIGAVSWLVLRPVVPWALEMYSKNDYKPILAVLVCAGMLVAPVDTLGLLRRLLPGKK